MASNLPVLFILLWLLPDVVTLEAIVWVMLAFAAFWAIKSRMGGGVYRSALAQCRYFFPFIVYSGVSIFWSVYWEISFGRWLVLIVTTICGIYLGVRYPFRRIVRFLAIFNLFLLAFSGFYAFFYPDIGIMNYYNIQGAWRGIFWHKNHLGVMAAFSALTCMLETAIAYQSRDKRGMVLWSAISLLSILIVVQSDSVAAIMTVIAIFGLLALGLLWLNFKARLTRRNYAVLAALLGITLVVLFLRLDDIFGLFNRNTSLTGRIPMWNYLFSAYFSQRPFWGYGFNAFWYIESHQLAVQAAAGYPDPIIIADNGFIDILINTGVVGFLLFLLFYFDLWRRSLACAIQARDLNDMLPLMVMAFILLANISWSVLFENENFFMLIMVALLASFVKSGDGSGAEPPGRD